MLDGRNRTTRSSTTICACPMGWVPRNGLVPQPLSNLHETIRSVNGIAAAPSHRYTPCDSLLQCDSVLPWGGSDGHWFVLTRGGGGGGDHNRFGRLLPNSALHRFPATAP